MKLHLYNAWLAEVVLDGFLLFALYGILEGDSKSFRRRGRARRCGWGLKRPDRGVRAPILSNKSVAPSSKNHLFETGD